MVHMDLAARNVLVGASNRCQIADFGLTNKMHGGKNYFQLPDKIPLAMKVSMLPTQGCAANTRVSEAPVWRGGFPVTVAVPPRDATLLPPVPASHCR